MEDLKKEKQQAVEEHRKMWNWIADETLKREQKVWKGEYFRKAYSLGQLIPKNECFCCEYNAIFNYNNTSCRLCPLEWGYDDCVSGSALYTKWYAEKNYEKAAEYARMIANLPERKNMHFYVV